MKKDGNKAILSTGLLAALASSLCCIAPLIAIFGGISGAASTFAWIEPARPYLIVISVLALGLAFYQAYKPKPVDDCGCQVEEKKSFLNSKSFLWTVTSLSILMFSFPYYSHLFYNQNNTPVITNDGNMVDYNVGISGMTCGGCENHIESALLPLEGVLSAEASYEKGNAIIQFDSSKTSKTAIHKAIQSTGYELVDSPFKTDLYE
ncbi:MAG: mercuric transport protein MerTP [Salibacteraceae bacterium]